MRKCTGFAENTGALKMGSMVDELRLNIVAHVITQHGYPISDDVRHILAETKVGFRRKPELMRKLTGVFSGL